MPLGGAFAVGQARLPLGGAFAVGEVRLPLGTKHLLLRACSPPSVDILHFEHLSAWRKKRKATASDATLDLPISILGLRWLVAGHVQQGAPHDRFTDNQHLACVLVFLWKRCVCRWAGAFAVGRCVCRWRGAFAGGKCVCRWAVRLPVGLS